MLRAFAGVVQVKPDSSVQVLEQPSPLLVSPSSHASGNAVLRMPSPQTRIVQSTSHVAVGNVAASHASPAFNTPFPHEGLVHMVKPFAGPEHEKPVSTKHVDEQPSPLIVLPSSHISDEAGLRRPSPHTRTVQSMSQVAVGNDPAGAGSHCSGPPRTPFPHALPKQELKPFSGPEHEQPASTKHVDEQQSPLNVLLSSHTSPATALRTPSPHTRTVQSISQVAVGSDPAGAGSQDSPGFTMPFPHMLSEQEVGEPSIGMHV